MRRWRVWALRIGAGAACALLGVYLLLAAYAWLNTPEAGCRVVVLMFHGVGPEGKAGRYLMAEGEFGRQMGQLKQAGAVTRPLEQVIEALHRSAAAGACPFEPHEVIITFDMDGPSEQVRWALPHLLRNGFTAAFFVPSGFLDRPAAVSRAEVRTLANAGMTIGSHTQYHYDMRTERPDSMIASLLRSRDTLRVLTGQPITALSAPGGRYNGGVIAGVRKAGFEAFFTSDPCYLGPRSSPYRLCRVAIRGDRGMTALDAATRPNWVALQAAGWWVKRGVEAVVGRAAWSQLHRLEVAVDY